MHSAIVGPHISNRQRAARAQPRESYHREADKGEQSSTQMYPKALCVCVCVCVCERERESERERERDSERLRETQRDSERLGERDP